jgi:predicted PurR-regulated permease PerM
VLSEFVRGQVLVILVMCLFYSVALWMAGWTTHWRWV